MRRILTTLVLLVAAATSAAVKIGDQAPPIETTAWLNGAAVNPAKPASNTTYVIEFLTSGDPICKASLPLLADIDKRYRDKRVVVLAVTDEPEDVVRPFATNQAVQFRIALDTNKAASARYLEGVEGVPRAFVVNKDGVVVWSGHPLSGLEEVVEGVVKGTFDYKEAARQQNTEAELQTLLDNGELDKALGKVDELIQHDPKSFEYCQLKLGLLAESGNLEGVKKMYREMLATFNESADDLNTLAWIAASSPFEMRDLETAWKASQRAAQLSERKNGAILDTLARVQYELGYVDEAAKIQAEAVRAGGSDEEKPEMQATLRYYRGVVQLREKLAKERGPAAEPKPETKAETKP